MNFPSGYCLAEQDTTTKTTCCFVVFWNSDSNTWIDVSTNKQEEIIKTKTFSQWLLCGWTGHNNNDNMYQWGGCHALPRLYPGEDDGDDECYGGVFFFDGSDCGHVCGCVDECGDRGDGHDDGDGDGGHDGGVVDEWG